MSFWTHETKHENKAEGEGKDSSKVSPRFKTGAQIQANSFTASGMGTLMRDGMDCEEHKKPMSKTRKGRTL
jgi:hypothetical protein